MSSTARAVRVIRIRAQPERACNPAAPPLPPRGSFDLLEHPGVRRERAVAGASWSASWSHPRQDSWAIGRRFSHFHQLRETLLGDRRVLLEAGLATGGAVIQTPLTISHSLLHVPEARLGLGRR
jgi:hypothetical protein